MPKQPDTVDATIHDLSTDGRGVTRVGEAAYFVEQAFPGDKVTLALHPGTKPPSASVISLIEPSALRVEHPCPHAAVCQGSLWGSFDYSAQLKIKRDLVERTLRKAIGDVTVLPTVPSPLPWRYRNRISLHVWQRENCLEVGYHTEARQQTGVPIHTCYLPTEPIAIALQSLSASLSNLDPSVVGSAPVRIQIHHTTRGAGLLLSFAQAISTQTSDKWLKLVGHCAPGGIYLAEASAAGVINYRRPILHSENAFPVRTEWLGQVVDVHPAAFTQANSGAANQVGARLLQFREQGNYRRVWDLYGGFGALGLAAAGTERQLTVFELSRFSEDSLERLAKRMGAKRAQFVAGDLLKMFPSHAGYVGAEDLILLDPPRSGSHPQLLSQIAHSKARYVIYLSCNPARLGRDLSILLLGGYRLTELQPYDFFPQTPATEALAILERS